MDYHTLYLHMQMKHEINIIKGINYSVEAEEEVLVDIKIRQG